MGHNTKYEVDFDVEEYLEKTDPEKKALQQKERIQVLVNKILRWLTQEGRPIDVEDVYEDLDKVMAEYMSKVKNGNPLNREQMEELNSMYNTYNNDARSRDA